MATPSLYPGSEDGARDTASGSYPTGGNAGWPESTPALAPNAPELSRSAKKRMDEGHTLEAACDSHLGAMD